DEANGLKLSRTLPDRVISQATKAEGWPIPADTFVYEGSGELEVSARLGNGASLPDWIEFDPEEWSFTLKQVPEGIESLEIVVEARSPEGESVTTSFNLLLSEEGEGADAVSPSSANLSEQMMRMGEFARETELNQLLQDLERV
ncbi:hypothetical protein, partial [Marinobacter sediminum]|uniref:hypothetical protein n=1 Tax=Marinobacter sediminum TaxID=256323 RepID=UPI003565A9BE